MKDGHVEATHLTHLRINMKRVPIVAQTIKEGLVLLSSLFLDEVGFTLRDRKELLLDGALVAKTSEAPHKQTRPNSAVKFARLRRDNLRVEDQKGSLAFVLEVGNVLLNDVFITRHERLLKNHLLFTVQKHHRVEGGNAWHGEITIGKGATMAHSDSIGGERLEVRIILVSELVVLVIHSISLEANTKRVKNRIVVGKRDLVRLLLELKGLLNVHSFDHRVWV